MGAAMELGYLEEQARRGQACSGRVLSAKAGGAPYW